MGSSWRYGTICFRPRYSQGYRIRFGTRTPIRLFQSRPKRTGEPYLPIRIGLWQIHPFGEGNTRTTAVFTILYLRSMGLNVTNDLFAHHSWYFRNALVRANYQNIQKGIMRDSEYLKRFFRNLLLGENNELRNRYMIVHAPEEWVTEQTQHETRTSTEQPTVQVTEQVRAYCSPCLTDSCH